MKKEHKIQSIRLRQRVRIAPETKQFKFDRASYKNVEVKIWLKDNYMKTTAYLNEVGRKFYYYQDKS